MFTVNDFKKIKELGSGKYGQVSLVQEVSVDLCRKIQVVFVP